MNKDIIRMAKEAGIEAETDTLCRNDGWVEPLKTFAALVLANAALLDTYPPHLEFKPEKRPWVGLTETEKYDCYLKIDVWSRCIEAVEALLKEKNA